MADWKRSNCKPAVRRRWPIEAYQDKLKLSDDQKSKLTDLADARRKAAREAFQAAAGGDRTEARKKIAEASKESSTKMLDVLTTEQKEAFEKMQGKKLELRLGSVWLVRRLRPTQPRRQRETPTARRNRSEGSFSFDDPARGGARQFIGAVPSRLMVGP